MSNSTQIHLRMKQAIEWLKSNKGLKQQDLAKMMGMAESSFSRALRRCEERTDRDFVIKFHQATGEIFSLEWLLDGTGPKSTEQVEQKTREPAIIDSSSALNAAISAYV
ncbi:MAG: helix-turn-helix domain-containing protein, partial [Bacteroidaceae bacterium]|nr:helix-turn-helix domain-containing protein [Bacteroidaceae bacterium]